MYWVEVRSSVRRSGPPRLIPLADVDGQTGFRSIVAYPEDVAQLIRDQGGTANLRGQPVYADTLFIDFDGHEPTEFRAWLQGSGLAYTEWDSGNRSVHFHIPLVPIFGPWVTDAMRKWVKQHAPTADISFYHPAGQYRLPGTFHSKRPGQCKSLVCGREGNLLELRPAARETFAAAYQATGSREEFFRTLTQAVGEGHRRPRAWLLATQAAECGMEFDDAVEHLLWWNGNLVDPPHEPETIIKQVESAYRRLAQRQA
jgi:hypothetical protein